MHQLQPTRMDLTPKFPETTSLTSFSILEDAGAALARLSGFVNGKAVSLLPEVDLRLLASEYAIDSNRIFQKVASPLFPIANRLRDPRAEPDVSIDPNDPSGHATLLGTNVRFPMNHRGSGDASPPHHLHGSLFRRRADSTVTSEGPRTASTESIFKTRPLTNWAEEVEVTIRHSLSEGKYRYELRAKNRGEHSVPIGMGAHPYFQLPSGDPKSARLFLPSIRVAEIDGLGNVFPTGRWISVPQSRFDFCSPAPLPDGGFDHFFLFDPIGPRALELQDHTTGVAFRVSARSPNILGTQFYYPGSGSIFALEFVTHLPDPREAVWGNQPTGLRLLAPGETETYAFEIEIRAL